MPMSMSRPGSSRGSHLPYRTLAGVVPVPKGWLMASAKLQGITMAPEQPQVVKTFLEVLDYKPAFQVVALFSPVGLLDEPDSRGRTCDREARALLGRPRAGAVLSAPVRAALRCDSYEEAKEANGGSLSAVGWSMLKRTKEVHEQMAPYWQRTIYRSARRAQLLPAQRRQARPFLQAHPGRSRGASSVARRAYARRGADHQREGRRGQQPAHLLDAAACLWTARRVISRGVVHLPEHPEWDSEGLRMGFSR